MNDQMGESAHEQEADKTFKKTITELRFEMCEQKDKALKESERMQARYDETLELERQESKRKLKE